MHQLFRIFLHYCPHDKTSSSMCSHRRDAECRSSPLASFRATCPNSRHCQCQTSTFPVPAQLMIGQLALATFRAAGTQVYRENSRLALLSHGSWQPEQSSLSNSACKAQLSNFPSTISDKGLVVCMVSSHANQKATLQTHDCKWFDISNPAGILFTHATVKAYQC